MKDITEIEFNKLVSKIERKQLISQSIMFDDKDTDVNSLKNYMNILNIDEDPINSINTVL